MPQYTVQAPDGRAVTLTGDAPPNETDLDEIFSKIGASARKPASAEDFMTPEATPKGSALGRFASNVGEMLNPVTMIKGLGSAIAHPIDTASALVGAQVDQGRKAISLAKEGRYSEAAGHGTAALLPLLGPAAAEAGEQIGTGDVAGGLGKGVGLLAPIAVGAVAPKAVTASRGIKSGGQAAADAVALAERSGVPLDAATASGNRFVRAGQHMADRSLGGSLVAEKAAQAQGDAMATLGEQLAAKGYKLPQSAEQAGESASAGVLTQVRGNADLANDAYGLIRKAEADPAHARVVPTAGGGSELMPLPVDLREAKTSLRPVFEELDRQRGLTPFMAESGKAKAFDALDRLMKAPDHAPLSVVDAALGELKAFTRAGRAGEVPELATAGQGKIKLAVAQLDYAVNRTAASAGKDVQAALREGRTATIAKYEAADVLEGLSAEPVKTFRALTAPGDSAIEKLRAVAVQAPDAIPQIGRAKLDALVELAPDKRFAEWQKLGPATKHALYQDASYVKDLDSFFRLSKMMATNPNPSGTAHTLASYGQVGVTVAAPWIGVPVQIGAAAVSKLLHSQAGVRLLTKGLTIPVGNKAAGAAWLADLTAATSPSGSRTPDPASAR
jgi:hypothetical protein